MSNVRYELQENAHVPAGTALWRRPTWDGYLVALVANAETGWQITVSHFPDGTKGRKRVLKRYPTIVELAQARSELAADVIFICTVPTAEETAEMKDTSIDMFEFPPRNPLEETRSEKQLDSGLYVPK